MVCVYSRVVEARVPVRPRLPPDPIQGGVFANPVPVVKKPVEVQVRVVPVVVLVRVGAEELRVPHGVDENVRILVADLETLYEVTHRWKYGAGCLYALTRGHR